MSLLQHSDRAHHTWRLWHSELSPATDLWRGGGTDWRERLQSPWLCQDNNPWRGGQEIRQNSPPSSSWPTTWPPGCGGATTPSHTTTPSALLGTTTSLLTSAGGIHSGGLSVTRKALYPGDTMFPYQKLSLSRDSSWKKLPGYAETTPGTDLVLNSKVFDLQLKSRVGR